MDGIEIRKLTSDDLHYINKMQRLRGQLEVSEDVWDANKGIWVIYGAFLAEDIIGISFLFPYHRIPHEDYPSGYIAELGGTYTVPDYRGMGIASEIVDAMLRNIDIDLPGLDAIDADSTDEGLPIYRRFGFEDGNCNRIWKRLYQ